MKHTGSALLFLGFASACTPAAPHPDTAQLPPPLLALGCNAQTSRDWSAVGSQYYVIEAEAHGETCAAAIATMRIKSLEGAVLFTHDYPVASVSLAFNPNNDQTGLRADLEAWIQNTAEPETTDRLPAWRAGTARPSGFEPAVTRGQYESARGTQGPLFCFPDGGESNACVAMDGARGTLLGSLTPEHL